MKKQQGWYWFLVFICLTVSFPAHSWSSSETETESEEDAVPVESEMAIELEREVHFRTPQGEDVVVSSGTYTVEWVEDALRLKPSDDGEGKAAIIQAEHMTHEESLESPQLVSRTGEDDQHVVMLLFGSRDDS